MFRIETANEQLKLFLQAFGKENDRGAALAAAVFTEEILDKILCSFLAEVPSTKELTTGFAAPIGTLAAKTKLAYSLGLLDQDLYNSINTLRHIRNEFAHKWTPVMFDAPHIQALIDTLPDHPIQKSFPKLNITRDKFDLYISGLLLELSYIPDLIKREQRTPKRIIQFGKFHSSKEAADAERKEYERTGIPPWKIKDSE